MGDDNFIDYLNQLTNKAENKEILQKYKDDLSSVILERLTQAAEMGLHFTTLNVHQMLAFDVDNSLENPAPKQFPHGNNYEISETETNILVNEILVDLGFKQHTEGDIGPIYTENHDVNKLRNSNGSPLFFQDYNAHKHPVIHIYW